MLGLRLVSVSLLLLCQARGSASLGKVKVEPLVEDRKSVGEKERARGP